MSEPYVCPVCSGRGLVPSGFYSYMTSGSSIADEMCRSCDGRGVLWTASALRHEPSPEALRAWADRLSVDPPPHVEVGTALIPPSILLRQIAAALERKEGDDGE